MYIHIYNGYIWLLEFKSDCKRFPVPISGWIKP